MTTQFTTNHQNSRCGQASGSYFSVFLWLNLMLWNFAPAMARDGNFEYAVKATYLLKFAPFVAWPLTPDPGTQVFTICLAGADPFGSSLDNAVRDEQVNGKRVAIVRLTNIARISECHVLYTGVMPWTDELRGLVHGKPILTIAEDGTTNDAMIKFLLVNGRVRFRADAIAAAESNLVLSSKLLSLATTVRRQEK